MRGKGTKGIPKIIPFSGFLHSGFSPFSGFGIFTFGIISSRKSSWRPFNYLNVLVSRTSISFRQKTFFTTDFWLHHRCLDTSGLCYRCVMNVIYYHNESGLSYKCVLPLWQHSLSLSLYYCKDKVQILFTDVAKWNL